jgi:hypothetical protein
MTRKEFADLFAKLCIAVNQEVKGERAAVYFEYLGHLTQEQFNSAVRAVLQNEPVFADIPSIQAILKYTRPDDKALALRAWNRVLYLRGHAQMHPTGYNPETGSIYQAPPEIQNNEALFSCIRRIGGWQKFCEYSLNDYSAKNFCDAFENVLTDPGLREMALGAGEGKVRELPGELKQLIGTIGHTIGKREV